MAFDHIVDVLTVSEAKDYEHKEPLVSSLRKTIVIHTASIIEALLLWKLKQVINKKEVELSNEWKYINVKILHKISSSEEIIGAKRKKETRKIDRLDFNRIIKMKNTILSKIDLGACYRSTADEC